EKVAPDHVSYYSYANLQELTRRHGFCVQGIRWYHYSPRARWVDRLLHGVTAPVTWIWPQLSAGLIATCIAGEAQPRHGSTTSAAEQEVPSSGGPPRTSTTSLEHEKETP
ncbi:hypothetical protein LYNGBM3L_75140, partial [Moorena producens 3L]